MALEPRRDQPVRLPNPSAQPFVVALKTARFYAVVLFWVTMVCVLAHVTTFILAEWVALYDLPQAGPAAPEPAEVKPATEPAKEPAPADTSGFGIFENSALAAPAKSAPGELFPGVPFEGGAKKPGTPAEPTKPPKEPAKTTPAEMPKEPPSGAATEGKVVGQPEVRPKEVEPLTPAERRQKVMHYRNVTADILRPARIVGVLASFLLAVTVFLYLQIALLGRLSGIRQLTNALFLLLGEHFRGIPGEFAAGLRRTPGGPCGPCARLVRRQVADGAVLRPVPGDADRERRPPGMVGHPVCRRVCRIGSRQRVTEESEG